MQPSRLLTIECDVHKEADPRSHPIPVTRAPACGYQSRDLLVPPNPAPKTRLGVRLSFQFPYQESMWDVTPMNDYWSHETLTIKMNLVNYLGEMPRTGDHFILRRPLSIDRYYLPL